MYVVSFFFLLLKCTTHSFGHFSTDFLISVLLSQYECISHYIDIIEIVKDVFKIKNTKKQKIVC